MASPSASKELRSWEREATNIFDNLISILSVKQQGLAQKERDLELERESLERRRRQLEDDHVKKSQEMSSKINEMKLAYDVKWKELHEEERLMKNILYVCS